MSIAEEIVHKHKVEKENYRGTDPKVFIIWLLAISSCMYFAGLTSAYIVTKAEGNWLEFDLPSMFTFSTVIIVLSSVSMQLSYFYTKRDTINLSKVFIAITILMGLLFLYTQFLAFKELYYYDYKIVFAGKQSNPSGSFLYVFALSHGLHILLGLTFLVITLVLTFLNRVHSKQMLWMKISTTFWHFLGGLWIYLFIFLVFNHL